MAPEGEEDDETGRRGNNLAASRSKAAVADYARVDRTRARTGLMAVIVSDLAIAGAAIAGVIVVQGHTGVATSIVSILTSAFTAIGTLTTAYFGIKAAANTVETAGR